MKEEKISTTKDAKLSFTLTKNNQWGGNERKKQLNELKEKKMRIKLKKKVRRKFISENS